MTNAATPNEKSGYDKPSHLKKVFDQSLAILSEVPIRFKYVAVLCRCTLRGQPPEARFERGSQCVGGTVEDLALQIPETPNRDCPVQQVGFLYLWAGL